MRRRTPHARRERHARLAVAAAVCAAALGTDSVLAELRIDLRATAATNGTVVNGKTVVGVSVGTTVTLQAWAQVTGSAGNSTPGLAQTLFSCSGSFLSTGALPGNFLPVTSVPGIFRFPSWSAGFQTDLDGDGDLDIGSNNSSDAQNFFAVIAPFLVGPKSNNDGSIPSLVVNTVPGGWEYLIGTARFIVGSGGPNTLLRFRPNQAPVGAVWGENSVESSADNGDGTTGYSYFGGAVSAGTGTYSTGTSVLVSVPEPIHLGLAGLIGLGLLARRRITEKLDAGLQRPSNQQVDRVVRFRQQRKHCGLPSDGRART